MSQYLKLIKAIKAYKAEILSSHTTSHMLNEKTVQFGLMPLLHFAQKIYMLFDNKNELHLGSYTNYSFGCNVTILHRTSHTDQCMELRAKEVMVSL